MSSEFDYYAVLGVRPNAPNNEIKQQYHLLAKLYHPDTNPGEEDDCARRMRLVNEAYRVLSSPSERANYDIMRDAEQRTEDQSYRPAHASEPPPVRPWTPPNVNAASMADRPRSRTREAVIATVAGLLVVGGVVMVSYNLLTPMTPAPVANNQPDPISVQYIPPAGNTAATVAVHPTGAVAHVEHVESVVSSPRRRTGTRNRPYSRRRETAADKDAVAAAIAAKYEAARRASDDQ